VGEHVVIIKHKVEWSFEFIIVLLLQQILQLSTDLLHSQAVVCCDPAHCVAVCLTVLQGIAKNLESSVLFQKP